MPKTIEFEKKMQRLEDIADRLGEADVSLSDSIKLYEEGSKLINELNSELDAAEKKVKILSVGDEGFTMKDYE